MMVWRLRRARAAEVGQNQGAAALDDKGAAAELPVERVSVVVMVQWWCSEWWSCAGNNHRAREAARRAAAAKVERRVELGTSRSEPVGVVVVTQWLVVVTQRWSVELLERTQVVPYVEADAAGAAQPLPVHRLVRVERVAPPRLVHRRHVVVKLRAL